MRSPALTLLVQLLAIGCSPSPEARPNLRPDDELPDILPARVELGSWIMASNVVFRAAIVSVEDGSDEYGGLAAFVRVRVADVLATGEIPDGRAGREEYVLRYSGRIDPGEVRGGLEALVFAVLTRTTPTGVGDGRCVFPPLAGRAEEVAEAAAALRSFIRQTRYRPRASAE